MSRYSTEIRFICESLTGLKKSSGFNAIDGIITKAAPLIFSFDFPIFDEDYRLPLEKKILRHFYTREIGEETYGLWKLRLDDKMNIIMPYYNQLYKSELLDFNPLYDVDITRQHTLENTGNSTTNTESNNTTSVTGSNDVNHNYEENLLKLYSDTPQGGIEGMDTVPGVMNYLTNATKESNNNNYTDNATNKSTTTDKGTTEGTNTANNTETYLEKVTGKQGSGSSAKLIQEFRETFLNIDKMILDELEPLFFGLWQ